MDDVICGLLEDQNFTCFIQAYENSPQNSEQVENAFNLLTLILDNISAVSCRFEVLLTGICMKLLQINFEIADQLFKVLNLLYDKEIQQFHQNEVELFNDGLQNFINVF